MKEKDNKFEMKDDELLDVNGGVGTGSRREVTISVTCSECGNNKFRVISGGRAKCTSCNNEIEV